MQNYLGNTCPYCGEKFADSDDIVVCPECGTPHHRSCYIEHSACANEEKHSETFEWKNAALPPVQHRDPAPVSGGITVCAHCGNENPANSRYCLGCGAPLGASQVHSEPEKASYDEFQRERERIFTEGFTSDLNGISPKEAAVFVRSNVGYFLPRFAAFSKGAKFDTNFSAFIFSYYYLFYRKMYGLGLAVFVATMILSIPTFLLDFQVIQEQYVELGMLSQVIWNVPHQEELAIYSVISSLFIWAIRICLMIFFNRIYFSKVVSSVKNARESLSDADEKNISGFFSKKGGTSLVVPIIAVCLTFAASFVLAGFIVSSEFFIMPDLSKFL